MLRQQLLDIGTQQLLNTSRRPPATASSASAANPSRFPRLVAAGSSAGSNPASAQTGSPGWPRTVITVDDHSPEFMVVRCRCRITRVASCS